VTTADDNGSSGAAPRRRVLMICYYFPPLSSSGTMRSVEFVKRLPQHGWDPVVLTVADAKEPWSARHEPIPEGVEVHRTRELNLHGLTDFLHGASCRAARVFGQELKRNLYRELICLPDPQIAWQTTLTGSRLARRCDAVYASCSPFSSALSACLIKRVTGRPAIVDFRDPWSLNTHHRDTARRRAAIARMESFVIEHADRVILNTEGTRDLYQARYPGAAARFTVIPNGYDALNLAPPRAAEGGDGITIMHVGHFYGLRQPDRLLAALAELNDPGVEFVQVGSTFPSLKDYEGRVRIRVIPSVPRAKALELMRSASILYLVQGRVEGERDVAVAAKTYEYLATGLPILADCPPGDNAEMVERYATRAHVVTTGREEDVAAALRGILRASRGFFPSVRSDFVATFARERLASSLAAELSRVAAT
jgi:glycosyltransferase involved in cell wall biosynthesis